MKKQIFYEVEANEEFFSHFQSKNDRQCLIITRDKNLFYMDTWIVSLYYGRGKRIFLGIPFFDDLGKLFRTIDQKEEQQFSRFHISDHFFEKNKLNFFNEEIIVCVEDEIREKSFKHWYLKWQGEDQVKCYKIIAKSLDDLVHKIAKDSEE